MDFLNPFLQSLHSSSRETLCYFGVFAGQNSEILAGGILDVASRVWLFACFVFLGTQVPYVHICCWNLQGLRSAMLASGKEPWVWLICLVTWLGLQRAVACARYPLQCFTFMPPFPTLDG